VTFLRFTTALLCIFFFKSDINICLDILTTTLNTTPEPMLIPIELENTLTDETTLVEALVDANTKQNIKPDYSEVVRLAKTIEIPDDYFEKMSYLDRERAKDIENALRIGASTDDEFIESKMFFKMQKAYQILEPRTEGEIFIENFLNRGLENIKPFDEYEINYTNKINIKGQIIDISD